MEVGVKSSKSLLLLFLFEFSLLVLLEAVFSIVFKVDIFSSPLLGCDDGGGSPSKEQSFVKLSLVLFKVRHQFAGILEFCVVESSFSFILFNIQVESVFVEEPQDRDVFV